MSEHLAISNILLLKYSEYAFLNMYVCTGMYVFRVNAQKWDGWIKG